MKPKLSPTLIRFMPYQARWLKKESRADGMSAALLVRQLVHLAMVNHGAIEGACECCNDIIYPGQPHMTSPDLLCGKCMKLP